MVIDLDDMLSVVIGDHLYYSKQTEAPNGAMSYGMAERRRFDEKTKHELLDGARVMMV